MLPVPSCSTQPCWLMSSWLSRPQGLPDSKSIAVYPPFFHDFPPRPFKPLLKGPLSRAFSRSNSPNSQHHFFGLAIGLVLVAASSCQAISGAILNPAASLGLEVAGGGQHGPYGLAYALVQLLGGGLAVAAFQTRKSGMKDLLAEFLGTFLPFGAGEALIYHLISRRFISVRCSEEVSMHRFMWI